MRILLTGRTGQIGSELERSLAKVGEVVATDRAELDLLDLNAIQKGIEKAAPEIVVNAAGYTAVDRAESERELAFRVNSEAVRRIGMAAASLGALVVHFSTDYVFDGEKKAPYAETDPPNPLNVYGASKFAGERALAATGCRHFIFRTSWVYGPRGSNFLLAILDAARTKRELRVVNDQRGAPTSAAAIADAISRVLSRADVFSGKTGGIYHMTAAGETTWHGFASAIVDGAGLKIPVVPIRSEGYPVAARRPKNSLLENSKLFEAFGIALRDWREDVAAVLAAIH